MEEQVKQITDMLVDSAKEQTAALTKELEKNGQLPLPQQLAYVQYTNDDGEDYYLVIGLDLSRSTLARQLGATNILFYVFYDDKFVFEHYTSHLFGSFDKTVGTEDFRQETKNLVMKIISDDCKTIKKRIEEEGISNADPLLVPEIVQRKVLCLPDNCTLSILGHTFEGAEELKDYEREHTINDKIQRLTTSLRDELQADISSKNSELKKELEETQMMRVKPLREFMTEFYSAHEVYPYSYVESVICNTISSNQSKFKSYIFDEIDACSTKDDTQSTMERYSVVSYGESCFNNCYTSFKDILSKTHSSYVENFNEFKNQFTEMFSIDAIDFNYTLLDNPSWQQKYKFKYDIDRGATYRENISLT